LSPACCPGRKVTGALKIVHEKFQKTDLYSTFLDQFSDAVTKNEFIEAHLRKVSTETHPSQRSKQPAKSAARG